MKKNLFILILVIFLLPFCCQAKVTTYTRTIDNPLIPDNITISDDNKDVILKTPAVDSSKKIYDFKDVLTEEEINQLRKKLIDFIHSSDVECVIIITDDLLGFDINTYAKSFYDYNYFSDNGIIFVLNITPNEPVVYMDNKGNRDSVYLRSFTQGNVQSILKYIYNDINNGEYYVAFDKYIQILQGLYDLTNKGGDYKVSEDGTIKKSIPWIELIILGCAITFIIDILLIYHLKGISKTNKEDISSKIDEESMVVKLEKDELTSTSSVKQK